MSLQRLTFLLTRRQMTMIVCSLMWIPSFLFPPKAGVLLHNVTSRRTLRPSGRYVCIMLHTRVVSCLTICTHFTLSTESFCVSTASTGDGEGWRKTSSLCFAVLCTRDSVQAEALRYIVSLYPKTIPNCPKFIPNCLRNFLDNSQIFPDFPRLSQISDT